MIVELVDGTHLVAVDTRAYVINFQNAPRDCIELHFDANTYSLDEIDAVFTRENSMAITLIDDRVEPNNVAVHRDYCLRRSLRKTTDHSYGGQTTIGSLQHDADDERVIVEMAQLTEAEKVQADLLDAVDTLILSSLE